MKSNHLIDVRTISEDGPTVHFVATPPERDALAKRFDIPRLDLFEVTGSFSRDDLIAFDGTLRTKAERICIATLKPFIESTEHPVHLLFSENPQKADDDPDVDILPIQKGKIDLLDVFSEEFGLSLNPFPKSIDTYTDYHDTTDTALDSPFAVLKKLKHD